MEEKIETIRYARENGIPFLGICLGMQLALVEIASNLTGITDTTSTEFEKEGSNLIDIIEHILPDDKVLKNIGGTMRLGGYALGCELLAGSSVRLIYVDDIINEPGDTGTGTSLTTVSKERRKSKGLCSVVSPRSTILLK